MILALIGYGEQEMITSSWYVSGLKEYPDGYYPFVYPMSKGWAYHIIKAIEAIRTNRL